MFQKIGARAEESDEDFEGRKPKRMRKYWKGACQDIKGEVNISLVLKVTSRTSKGNLQRDTS